MSYSGASSARTARENLGRALAALQADPNIPPDVLNVAQNIAQAVGALFEAERASSESDGKASVKAALGMVGQTLALLQDVRTQNAGVQMATETIAQTMSVLFPLTTVPSRMPPPMASPSMPGVAPSESTMPQSQWNAQQPPMVVGQPLAQQPQLAAPPVQQAMPQAGAYAATPYAAPAFSPPQQAHAAPAHAAPYAQHAPQQAPSGGQGSPFRDNRKREQVEVNIGATTESNFFVGFSGEIAEGGVFAATYNIFEKGTPVAALVTLPGGFEKTVLGHVRFVRDPMDMTNESEPGMGIQFEALDHEARELILRFIRKRPPMFYDE